MIANPQELTDNDLEQYLDKTTEAQTKLNPNTSLPLLLAQGAKTRILGMNC